MIENIFFELTLSLKGFIKSYACELHTRWCERQILLLHFFHISHLWQDAEASIPHWPLVTYCLFEACAASTAGLLHRLSPPPPLGQHHFDFPRSSQAIHQRYGTRQKSSVRRRKIGIRHISDTFWTLFGHFSDTFGSDTLQLEEGERLPSSLERNWLLVIAFVAYVFVVAFVFRLSLDLEERWFIIVGLCKFSV